MHSFPLEAHWKLELARLMENLPGAAGAEHAYAQPIPELEVPGISSLYGLQLAIWQSRPADLQKSFPLQTIKQRLHFLAWCVVHGQREYQALRELLPFWRTLAQPAVIRETPWSGGISRFLQLVIAGRPDLGIDANLLKAEDQLAALHWYWCAGGYRELGQIAEQIPAWQKRFLINSDALEETRFARLLYLMRPDLQATFDLHTSDGRQGYRAWLNHYAMQETALAELNRVVVQAWPAQAGSQSENTLEPGVNLIGYAFGELGIGEDVRMAAHALHAAGIPFTIIDFPPGDNIRQQDRSVEHWVSSQPRYAVNIVCLTALENLRLYLERGANLFRGRYTIGYWPWELLDWPANWRHCFNLVDEVWASSRHIQQAAQRASNVPILLMPMSVKLPDIDLRTQPLRNRFGLPENRTLFVFSFDGNSYIERKNPLAIIEAFRLAFPTGQEPVGLIIKCMRPDARNPAWNTILQAAKTDPRLIVIDAMLSKNEVMELYRACDCFVSLHRAEGFGRGIAEALLLGLEVIATDHGGNTDFCRTAGAKLIPCHMKPLNPDDYVEASGQSWAEPDTKAAAQAMREVAHHAPNKANLIAPEQQKLLNDLFSPASIGASYRRRLANLINLPQ